VAGDDGASRRFDFPPWTNHLRILAVVAAVMVPFYAVLLIYGGFSPRTTAVGYQPIQPVPYSHALHVGQLGLDCRYCHTTVETAAFAAVPPTQTCMNCHQTIRKESPKLLPVRESFATGMPVRWIKVHDLPDFVYFDHSAHVRHGVGCVTCHGRIDKMEVVQQAEPLNMAWCLECHRQPEKRLRPLDQVTAMDWTPAEEPLALGRRLRQELGVNPSTDCSTCHR
jgi:hypothetical protein